MRIISGLALLAVVVVAGLWWRAVAVTRQLLRVDAPATIAERSGNVYQLAVGRVRFNPAKRRVRLEFLKLHLSFCLPMACLRGDTQPCTFGQPAW